MKYIYNILFLFSFYLIPYCLAVAGNSIELTKDLHERKGLHGLIADEINAIWQTQAGNWNKGDIEAYMSAYAKSNKLRFASQNTVKYGWQKTLQAYKNRYHSKELMGKLTFTEIETTVFSNQYAMIFGRYHLSRTIDGKKSDMAGLVSTIFTRQANGQWRIMYDHSSG